MEDQQQPQPHRKIHKGLTGLENLGNTCFINACIQVLAHSEIFTHLKERYTSNINKEKDESILLNEFEELRTIMLENEGIIRPEKFIRAIHILALKKNRPLFTGWSQNDMPEFLLFFMECMHNATCKSVNLRIEGNIKNETDKNAIKCYNELKQIYEKGYSPFMESFYGMYLSKICKPEQPHIELSVKPEHFFIIDLPIPRNAQNELHTNYNINIYDCFNAYCAPELLHGENAWYNESTKEKQDAVKRIRFWNFPPILIITLKRFTQNGTHKLQNHVDFPIKNLNLSKYVDGYNPHKYVYDLYGICNHMGGVHGGHYTAFVYHKDILNGVWLHHNDTEIDIVKEENLVMPTAYCLFYKLKQMHT